MNTQFWRLIRRDIRLVLRHPTDSIAALMFFVLVCALFPLALGPQPALLARIAPGVIWVAALLASLLPLNQLFRQDAEDGTLDQSLLSELPPSMLGLGKALAHWLTTGLPLWLAALPLGSMLFLNGKVMLVLLLALLPGTLILSLLGTLGAALLQNAQRGAALLPLLIAPLMMPALIMGCSSAAAAQDGLSPWPHLAILLALLAVALPVCPLVSAIALREAAAQR